MNKLKYLSNEIDRLAKLHPILEEEMLEYFDLAAMEIEEGGSIEHEVSLAFNSIYELIKISKNEL
jgi:hypothetical protein